MRLAVLTHILAGVLVWWVCSVFYDGEREKLRAQTLEMQVQSAAVEKALRDEKLARSSLAAEHAELKKEKARVQYKTVTRKVETLVDRPVYRNVCMDDAGLRLINSTLRD